MFVKVVFFLYFFVFFCIGDFKEGLDFGLKIGVVFYGGILGTLDFGLKMRVGV